MDKGKEVLAASVEAGVQNVTLKACTHAMLAALEFILRSLGYREAATWLREHESAVLKVLQHQFAGGWKRGRRAGLKLIDVARMALPCILRQLPKSVKLHPIFCNVELELKVVLMVLLNAMERLVPEQYQYLSSQLEAAWCDIMDTLATIPGFKQHDTFKAWCWQEAVAVPVSAAAAFGGAAAVGTLLSPLLLPMAAGATLSGLAGRIMVGSFIKA